MTFSASFELTGQLIWQWWETCIFYASLKLVGRSESDDGILNDAKHSFFYASLKLAERYESDDDILNDEKLEFLMFLLNWREYLVKFLVESDDSLENAEKLEILCFYKTGRKI